MNHCYKKSVEKRRKEMKENKPTVRLIGQDGNAFNLLGICKRAIREYPDFKWKQFYDEATSGDYDHLLQTIMKYFEVE